MRVLILVESATIGGHVISALTTARSLKRRGHEVSVVTGEGPLAETFAAEFAHAVIPFHFHHAGRQTYFSFRSLQTVRALARSMGGREFDVVHAFDARSYIVAYACSVLFRKLPLCATMCGGISPYYDIPSLGRLILFSCEQQRKMEEVYRWPRRSLSVVRNRIDLTLFEDGDGAALAELRERGIAGDERLVMMVTTFLGPKVLSIRQALDAMQEVLRRHRQVRFVVVGGKGDFYPEARAIGAGINDALGREGVVFTGMVKNAYRYLRHASLVMGQGRSAFEGMGFGKPTLIIGDHGYAGTISPESIGELAFYNFSGRNRREPVPPSALAAEVERLLGDGRYAGERARFGEGYVREELDIEAGVARIEQVYAENVAWFKERSRLALAGRLVRPLVPIVLDNYLNAAKRLVAG